MNDLREFSYDGRQVRAVEIGGEPWWVLKDVCDVLGLLNARSVADRLDDDEVSKFDLRGLSGESNIINESGLYNVIIRSDKPEARRFKRWVTHEVLPSIRRTGMYAAGAAIEAKLDAAVLGIAERVAGKLPELLGAALKLTLDREITEVKKIGQNYNPTEDEWKEIEYWTGILTEWRDFRRLVKNKAKADKDFLQYYNTKYPDAHIGLNMLYRKFRDFNEKGGLALIDRRGKHGNHRRAKRSWIEISTGTAAGSYTATSPSSRRRGLKYPANSAHF